MDTMDTITNNTSLPYTQNNPLKIDPSDIDYAGMVALLAKPGAEIVASMTPEDAHLWHMATGMCTEAHELAIYEGIENAVEELGDFLFYLEGACQAVGETLDTVSEYLLNTANLPELPIGSASCMLLDLVKKSVVYRQEYTVGDWLHHLAIVLKSFYSCCWELKLPSKGISLEDIKDYNKIKLATRYEGLVYTDYSATARADKNETKSP